ncbi:MAG: PEP-CTERM sorting domain-containing protein [Hyphomicrobiales bacterium]|nr:PEP-CTERM sorting domain-containing protein [Hyphomicrobiales bacterium]
MVDARRWCLGAAVAAAIASSPAGAVNLLLNPGFDIASGTGPTSYTGTAALGVSAAADWLVWNNTLSTTDTQQLPSTDPSGGGSMLEVSTGGGENGVYQFVAANSVSVVSVDVYLTSGSFELGLGQGGYYLSAAKTSTLDQWVRLTATYARGSAPGAPFPSEIGDEIFLYATNGAGADFFVDNAFAGTPEPSTWAMMLTGFAGLAFAGYRGARARQISA